MPLLLKEFQMKKFILIAMSIGLFSMGQSQKINLGKATIAVTKGAQALSFTNEDAKRL